MAMYMELSALAARPIVVILGVTGTGKSKLAVDLALRFNGEIISADSMQVYKGLDILTNKITASETKGIPHHLISMVDPLTKFDVNHFRKIAMPIVERIQQQSKVPIIVGGTNYYIESLLWKVLFNKEQYKNENPSKRLKLDESYSTATNAILSLLDKTKGDADPDDFQAWTNAELYGALEVVDPNRFKKLHPNDRRRVIRSLQIFFQVGKAHSELIQEQLRDSIIGHHPKVVDGTVPPPMCENTSSPERQTTDNKQEIPCSPNFIGGSLRYHNVVCLWIQTPKNILHERINQRVDEMIQKGLRDELNNYLEFLGHGIPMDFTEGLLQSIGFKEFEDYLNLTPEEKLTVELGDKLFFKGVERLKVVTKQYAKRQLKWIRQRFLCPGRRQVPPVYWLDGSCTDPLAWEANVTSVGIKILACYLPSEDNQLDDQILSERLVPEVEKSFDDMVARTCEICDRVLIGMNQWKLHEKSKKHYLMTKKKEEEQVIIAESSSNVQEMSFDDDLVARTCEICDCVLIGMNQWKLHEKSKKHYLMTKYKKKLITSAESSSNVQEEVRSIEI